MTNHRARIAIAGVSHHTADVMALEAFRFGDEPAFLAAARKRFRGVLLLQTCNRVEIMVEGDAGFASGSSLKGRAERGSSCSKAGRRSATSSRLLPASNR